MNAIPNNAKKIEIDGSTVDFFELVENNTIQYFFDTSECGAPEPMINAMAGLQLLDGEKKLIMINHQVPMGLFPKIQNNFNYEINELEDGKYKIVFSYKIGSEKNTDFSQNSCAG